MTDYIKTEGYIYANLCAEVSRALYEAMTQKGWHKYFAARKAHGGDMSLREIANMLAELGCNMEVKIFDISRTVKFIDAPDGMEGKKDEPGKS